MIVIPYNRITIMQSISYYQNHPNAVGLKLIKLYGGFLSDKTYQKIKFRLELGKNLDLDNPRVGEWLNL